MSILDSVQIGDRRRAESAPAPTSSSGATPFDATPVSPPPVVPSDQEFSGDYLPGFGGLGFELESIVAGNEEALVKKYAPGAETRRDANGNLMVMFPEGSEGLWKDAKPGEWMYLNKPGVSMRDLTDVATTGAAFAPAGSVFNLMRGAGAGALKAGGAAATAAGATQGALDWLGGALGTGEGVDPVGMAEAGLWQFIPDFGMSKFAGRPAGAGLPQIARERAEQNLAASERMGVDLTRGQAAGAPASLERTKVLGQLPETSYQMTDFMQQQNEQARRATRDVTEALTPSNLPEGQIPLDYAQRRAQGAIEGARAARREAGSPIYQASIHENPRAIDTTEIVNTLAGEIQGHSPGTPTHAALSRVQRWLGGERIENPDGLLEPSNVLSLEQAHNAQQELWDMADAARRAGNNNRARVLSDTRDEVIRYIEDTAPEYEEARNIWRELSKPVEELEQSVIGRMANADQATIESIANKAFDPYSRASSGVRVKMRDVLGEDAYNALLKDFIDKQLAKPQDIGTAELQNVPNQINRALFKNQAMRDMLTQFATADQRRAVEELSRVLDAAAKGRHVGSPTGTRQEVMRDLTSRLPESIGQILYKITGMGAADLGATFMHGKMTERIRGRALRDELPGGDMLSRVMREYQERPGRSMPSLSVGGQVWREEGDLQPLDFLRRQLSQ